LKLVRPYTWPSQHQKEGLPEPSPPPQLAELSPRSAELPSLTTWQWLRVMPSVRQRSAKRLRVTQSVRQVCAKESRDQYGVGWKNVSSSSIPQLKVISRNFFHKSGVENLLYLTAISKSAYIFSTSCEKRTPCLYGVRVYI
jgi:hypothetical protein